MSRLLYVSTIAVLYPSLADYPYGRSKQKAEALVCESDLDYTIVRPTVIADPHSDGFQALVKLASAPLLLRPGPCRAQLRPIDLEDLVSALAGLIRDRRFQRESFDLGGPESVSVLELMQRIRMRVHGREGPTLPLPMLPLLATLRALEAVWPGTPPVTAGQFSVFRFDGVGETERAICELGLQVRSIDAMLDRCVGESSGLDASAANGAAVLAGEAGASKRAIERECVVFSRYLVGRDPDPYLLRKYCEAAEQQTLPSHPDRHPDRFETLLIGLARLHPIVTRAVDIYARWLHPRATLRKRLILMLAIAESWAPSYAEIDRADGESQPVFFAKMAIQGSVSVALGIVATLVLHPIKLLLPTSHPSTYDQGDAGR